jgi:glucokinase
MFLGIEIGGTKLQLGVGPGDGKLRGLWRGTVIADDGAGGIQRQITAAIPELLGKAGIDRSALRGVGVGFGGPIDDNTRTVITSHQIAGWDGFPLADWITDHVGLPAVLGNDADVAGLAEALYGAGKGCSPIFYVTVGTGIGGGLVIDGEIYRGVGRGAAEIGHLRIAGGLGGDVQNLDHRPLEEYASGQGIERYAQRPSGIHVMGSRIFAGGSVLITAQKVAEAAAQGDDYALSVVGVALERLSEAICHVIALLCPRKIVIGGGVSLMGEELFFAPLRRLVAERVFAPFAGLTEIVPAALGEEVVVHGAVALARKKLS